MESDETGLQPFDSPILCANNCGFFGSATTMYLCSCCYREVLAKQAKENEAAVAISAVHAQLRNDRDSVVENHVSATSSLINDMAPSAAGDNLVIGETEKLLHEQSPLRKISRCAFCTKRVGLTGFKCRCGGLFCALHRYNDKHSCTFDYKAAAREAITKANPVIKADKIDKI